MAGSESNLVEPEDFLPTNSPELGAIISDDCASCGAAELQGRSADGVGKNEETSGAATYGKTAGEAESVGSVGELRSIELANKITRKAKADDLVVVAMNS